MTLPRLPRPTPALSDWEMEDQSRRIARLGRELSTAGVVLEIVVIVGAVCGVLIGFITAMQSRTDPISAERHTHPYVLLGIEIMIGSLLSGVLYWALMRALRLFGEYAAFRVSRSHGDDIGQVDHLNDDGSDYADLLSHLGTGHGHEPRDDNLEHMFQDHDRLHQDETLDHYH